MSVKPKTSLEPLIPEGLYCYTRTGRVNIQNKVFDFDGNLITIPHYFAPETKSCPFWKSAGNGDAYCSHMEVVSEYHDPCNLIWDQVKECDVNSGEELNLFELEAHQQMESSTSLEKARKRSKKNPRLIESLINILLNSETNELIYDGVAYTLSQVIIDELT